MKKISSLYFVILAGLRRTMKRQDQGYLSGVSILFALLLMFLSAPPSFAAYIDHATVPTIALLVSDLDDSANGKTANVDAVASLPNGKIALFINTGCPRTALVGCSKLLRGKKFEIEHNEKKLMNRIIAGGMAMKKGLIFSVNATVISIIICFFILCSVTAYASPGSIDLTFGTAGKVKTDFNSSQDQATASAIYTTGTHAGKIVVAGMVMNASNYDTFGVARYNANGTLDTTFDTDGKAPTVDLTGYFSRPWGVAIQSDDKIVVAGDASWGSPTSRNDLGVVRYNANGTLDTTFDSGGKMTRQVGSSHSSWQAVAIQSDGKILIAGQSYNGADYVDHCASEYKRKLRYELYRQCQFEFRRFNAIAVQSDGKIIAAGWEYDGTESNMVVVRFTSAGALDTSFNATGIQLLNGTKAFGTGGEGANALAIQSDGKILVGGTTDVSGQNAFAVARLNTDGSLDTSFNSTGKVILDPTTGSDYLKGIGVQSDGKIVLSGYGTGPSSGNFDFIAARLNSGGTIDTSFGSSGYVFIDFGDDDRGDAGLVIQSDNNSVIAGWSGQRRGKGFCAGAAECLFHEYGLCLQYRRAEHQRDCPGRHRRHRKYCDNHER